MAFSTAIDFRVTYNSRFNWKLENQLDSRQAPGSVGAMAYRHKDTALVVYFDGHVGEITQGEMKAIDGRGGKSNPFWNPKAR
jgi:prepilin-type processing-associated H-X9-DG protein